MENVTISYSAIARNYFHFCLQRQNTENAMINLLALKTHLKYLN
jgi:hypothetical protein